MKYLTTPSAEIQAVSSAASAPLRKFAFVIHPLTMRFIHQNPWFGWTRVLPDSLIEWVGGYFPPLKIARIRGVVSPTSGQRVEGLLITLGATPRQMMRHRPRLTYNRLLMAARMAQRDGAQLMGLGAFTSVVGDAGVTVAREAPIPITTGNSLTVAATLEAAKQALRGMGKQDLSHGRVMVIGATGSIGSACARLLAQAVGDVVLVSPDQQKLLKLLQRISAETPTAQLSIATRPDAFLPSCDLVITATSAFGQRIVDVSRCKPGAVICDVARPADIHPDEAALRPDVLVIESGEVLMPGDVRMGYDIGLPPKVAYACLAETALLAVEGLFESYTLGRDIDPARVKAIYRLFKKHQFELAPLRTFGEPVTAEMLAQKRDSAERYRRQPAQFEHDCARAAAKIAAMPMRAKGVVATPAA